MKREIKEETRELNITYNKSGSGSISTRISLPKTWIDNMNVTPEDRSVKVTFKNNKITIEKL